MGAKPKKGWYGVRTLYRVTAEGEPISRDKHFNPASTAIEDRVILIQATDLDDALAQGEKEARSYSRQMKFNNAYGQKVRMRYLDACNVWEIPEMTDGPPAAGWEVYSDIELVRESVSDAAVIRRRMGPKTSGTFQARFKFIDPRILRKAQAWVASKANPDKPPARPGSKT